MSQRKAKKECFRCDGKWEPGNKCKAREFEMIKLVMDLDSYSDDEQPVDEERFVVDQPRISSQALIDIPSHKCMVVSERLGKTKLVFL